MLSSQFSLFFQFLLPKQVTIEFWDGEHFSSNQCFQHIINIIWKLFEPSIHLWNTPNSKSPSNLHYCTFWASNTQLSFYSCVFPFYQSNTIYTSHISCPSPQTTSGTPPSSSSITKNRALHIDLVRMIQWVSEQARDWNTFREVKGSFRDHHIVPGSAHTSSGNLLHEVSFFRILISSYKHHWHKFSQTKCRYHLAKANWILNFDWNQLCSEID